ncbi:MAG: hypothetical protein AAF493_22390 [Pseudomonadota bacterium]
MTTTQVATHSICEAANALRFAPGSLNPSRYPYNVGFEMHIPFYDLAVGEFHMLMRYRPDNHGCPLHRHVARTETFVLGGEQIVRTKRGAANWSEIAAASPVRRQPGDVDNAGGPDELPHLEHGGEGGGLVLLVMRPSSDDQLLFQYFADNLTLKPVDASKALTIRNVVEGTRRQDPDAVNDDGDSGWYAWAREFCRQP